MDQDRPSRRIIDEGPGLEAHPPVLHKAGPGPGGGGDNRAVWGAEGRGGRWGGSVARSRCSLARRPGTSAASVRRRAARVRLQPRFRAPHLSGTAWRWCSLRTRLPKLSSVRPRLATPHLPSPPSPLARVCRSGRRAELHLHLHGHHHHSHPSLVVPAGAGHHCAAPTLHSLGRVPRPLPWRHPVRPTPRRGALTQAPLPNTPRTRPPHPAAPSADSTSLRSEPSSCPTSSQVASPRSPRPSRDRSRCAAPACRGAKHSIGSARASRRLEPTRHRNGFGVRQGWCVASRRQSSGGRERLRP